MTRYAKQEFKEILKSLPKEHPFEHAKLSKTHCYSDTPIYVTTPAYSAYTYPTYSEESVSFCYKHYDMEAETMHEVDLTLVDLIDGFDGDVKHGDFVLICELFGVPQNQINDCMDEYLKSSI